MVVCVYVCPDITICLKSSQTKTKLDACLKSTEQKNIYIYIYLLLERFDF